MTDDDLDRHLRSVRLAIEQHAFAAARDRLRLALDAARREGAEEMREKAAGVCDSFAPCDDAGGEPCAGCGAVANAMRQFAAAIRALPTGATS